MMTQNIQNELRRLKHGPRNDDAPTGSGIVRFIIKCISDPKDVLNRVRSLLCSIDQIALNGWLSDKQWESHLPEWFVGVCAKPMNAEEAARWLVWWKGLSREEQIRDEHNKAWSLDNWIYWMKGENRQWYWWDAKLANDNEHIFVAVQVECWPFPWGALRWLFRAAGASDVIAE
jgi:hypothetical protein